MEEAEQHRSEHQLHPAATRGKHEKILVSAGGVEEEQGHRGGTETNQRNGGEETPRKGKEETTQEGWLHQKGKRKLSLRGEYAQGNQPQNQRKLRPDNQQS